MSVYYNDSKAEMKQHNITLPMTMKGAVYARYHNVSFSCGVRTLLQDYTELVLSKRSICGAEDIKQLSHWYEAHVPHYIPVTNDSVATVNLPVELWAVIDRLASRNSLSRSETVRDLIHYWISYGQFELRDKRERANGLHQRGADLRKGGAK